MADLEILQAFISESLDLLDSLEPRLIQLQEACAEKGEVDPEIINGIFRPFHSMKGSAGMLELHNITSLTHTAETLLDLFRNGAVLVRPNHISLLFAAMDLVRQMLAHADAHQADSGFEEQVNELVIMLAAASAADGSPTAAIEEAAPEPARQAAAAAAPLLEEALFDLAITTEMLGKFIQEGGELLDQFEQSLLGYETQQDQELLIQAFRAIHSFKGNCGFMGFADLERLSHKTETLLDCMRLHKAGSPLEAVSTFLKLVDVFREALEQAGQGKDGSIPGCDIYLDLLNDILAGWEKLAACIPPAAAGAEAPAAEPHPEASPSTPPAPSGESGTKAPASETPPAARLVVRQDIRVDLRKLDSLLNLVGELVIAEAMMTRHPLIAQHEDEGVERAVHQLRRVSRELQDVAMSIRMIPLAATFQRMIRLVHDLSQKSGKKVNLELFGEDTEVDKTVIEQIGDPIVHIVRNAIDHGIETPEERRAAGKPEAASLFIEGRHEGGEVWIMIRDDGRGLNREKILAKALERGLVPGDPGLLADSQVYKLIFEPGFSTAEKVTDISGRGVGMDVVKRNIERIKGRVDIQSSPGRGAAFILRIPLTLAIIEGMLVRVGGSRYIVPLLAIRESVHPQPGQITVTPDGTELVRVRDDFFPVVRVHRLFGIKPDNLELHDGILVIVEVEGQTVGVFVDEIVGQQETVIKGLSEYVSHARGVSGCTILGDGEVSLILDIGSIIGRMNQAQGVC